MANKLITNPVYIDDFSAAIDMDTYHAGAETFLQSIEWSRPTDVTHRCLLFAGGTAATGVTIMNEQCIVVNQSIIKYFDGSPIGHIYIPATSGVYLASGQLIITYAR